LSSAVMTTAVPETPMLPIVAPVLVLVLVLVRAVVPSVRSGQRLARWWLAS
jgi:hypothetical protein